MNNIFKQNTLNAIVFELQGILLSYSPCCSYGKSSIFTKCSRCNTFQVIGDLVHDFMNFNALKIILKIHKKNN